MVAEAVEPVGHSAGEGGFSFGLVSVNYSDNLWARLRTGARYARYCYEKSLRSGHGFVLCLAWSGSIVWTNAGCDQDSPQVFSTSVLTCSSILGGIGGLKARSEMSQDKEELQAGPESEDLYATYSSKPRILKPAGTAKVEHGKESEIVKRRKEQEIGRTTQ